MPPKILDLQQMIKYWCIVAMCNMKSSQKIPKCTLCFLKALPQSAVNEAESNTETPMTEFQVTIKTPDKIISHYS